MPETLLELFRRDRLGAPAAPLARPDLGEVRRRSGRIRRRRQVVSVSAAVVAAVVVVGVMVPVLRGGRTSGLTPAATQANQLPRSADGFLELPDLRGPDDPASGPGWQLDGPPGSGPGPVRSVTVATCDLGGSTQSPIRGASTASSQSWTRSAGLTEIHVRETVARLDARGAATIDAMFDPARRCRAGQQASQVGRPVVLATGDGVLMIGTADMTLPPQRPPTVDGPIIDGMGFVRVGDSYIVIYASGESATGGMPGQAGWLADLLERATARATGRSITVEPNTAGRLAAAMAPSTDAAAPPGMLTLTDLGADRTWALARGGQDSQVDVPVLRGSVPACGSAGFTPVSGRGTEQTYRSVAPVPGTASGSFQSLLVERRITVAPKDVAAVRSALAALAACRASSNQEAVLRTGGEPLQVVTGSRMSSDPVRAGDWHTVTGMTLIDRTFVWIDDFISPRSGPVPPQLGHADWMWRLLPVAARRAG